MTTGHEAALERKALTRADNYLMINESVDAITRVGIGTAFTLAASAIFGSTLMLPAAITAGAWLGAGYVWKMSRLHYGTKEKGRYIVKAEDGYKLTRTMRTFNAFADDKKKNIWGWGILDGVISNPISKFLVPAVPFMPKAVILALKQ